MAEKKSVVDTAEQLKKLDEQLEGQKKKLADAEKNIAKMQSISRRLRRLKRSGVRLSGAESLPLATTTPQIWISFMRWQSSKKRMKHQLRPRNKERGKNRQLTKTHLPQKTRGRCIEAIHRRKTESRQSHRGRSWRRNRKWRLHPNEKRHRDMVLRAHTRTVCARRIQ